MRTICITAALATAASLTLMSSPAAASEDWVDYPTSYASTVLVGGDYVWGAAVNQPAPAALEFYWDEQLGTEVPIPPEWNRQINAEPLLVIFDWGDGTQTGFTSLARSDGAWVWCNNGAWYDDQGVPHPGDGFGYNCRVEAAHRYTSQGIRDVTIAVVQGDQTAVSPTHQQVVVDLAAGGSLTLKGTLEARAAGMYDMDFPQPGDDTTTTVNVTAKRKAGTTATIADVTITVPGMHPEYYNTSGMTFRGKAALEMLYIDKTRTQAHALLSRVEGRVTNNAGDAGGGYATIEVRTARGAPTLVRVQVWNTSAGFQYLDTGYQSIAYLGLAPQDVLLTGAAKIG